MAIRCPGCGREYDVTLFQFGRTLHCTCGERVGLQKRLGPELPEADARPRFLVDEMLEHLARWLRVMGYDAAGAGERSARERSAGERTDEALVRRALAERRILVTRDRNLPEEWRLRNVVVVDEDRPWDQLQALVRRLELDPEARAFTRCSRCNEPLDDVSPAQVREAVPPAVLQREERFRRCPACGRVYWEGGHTRRMRERLRSLEGR